MLLCLFGIPKSWYPSGVSVRTNLKISQAHGGWQNENLHRERGPWCHFSGTKTILHNPPLEFFYVQQYIFFPI
jgi:hypothetical protein